MPQLEPIKLPVQLETAPLRDLVGTAATTLEQMAAVLRKLEHALQPTTGLETTTLLPPEIEAYPADMPWNWQCHHGACGFVSSTLGQARAHLLIHQVMPRPVRDNPQA